MNCLLRQRAWQALSGLQGKDFLREYLGLGAAATLGGVKPATLLCLTRTCHGLGSLWENHGASTAAELGLSWHELRQNCRSSTVLLYRPEALEAHLHQDSAQEILSGVGFQKFYLPACLQELARRSTSKVPDEVGCFLGYPLHDVAGFMRHRGHHALQYRYWCVYQDLAGANALADRIDHARYVASQGLVHAA